MDLYPDDFEKKFGAIAGRDEEVDRILNQILFYKDLLKQITNRKKDTDE